jgi:hypothetical protein
MARSRFDMCFPACPISGSVRPTVFAKLNLGVGSNSSHRACRSYSGAHRDSGNRHSSFGSHIPSPRLAAAITRGKQ